MGKHDKDPYKDVDYDPETGELVAKTKKAFKRVAKLWRSGRRDSIITPEKKKKKK